MKRFFPFAMFCLLAASAASLAAEHDLLAHASVDRIWVARITTTQSADGPAEHTDILMQQDGADKPWQKLVTIPDRAVSLASRSSQLAVLLADGRWELIWAANGASTGPALPAGGRILALSDDGESLWAVGSVAGGFAVAAVAATESTTAPTTQPRSNLPQGLVLFHEHLGRWLPLLELPASAGGDISLAIVGDQRVVATKSADGSVRILRFPGKQLSANPPLILSTEPIADFDLLNIGGKTMLWTAPKKGAGGGGSLYSIGATAGSPLALAWPADTAPQLAAVAAVGATLTLFGLHDGKLYVQRYDSDGKVIGSVVAVSAPLDVRDTDLEYWIDAVLMAALGFSVLATLYRRGEQLHQEGSGFAPPPPAPQLRRLAAGLIDMLPVLVAFGYMTVTVDPARDPMEQLESVPNAVIYCVAVGIYLLHTTLCEIVTGRTIGKFILGLRTVTVDGTAPNVWQFLIRNLLRVIDLIFFPLTLVLISPLRQRSADVAAGTMVIRNMPKEPPDEASGGS